MTAQRPDEDRLIDSYHQRNEGLGRAIASPQARQHYQNLPPLQQDNLPHQRPAVLSPVATSRTSTTQSKSGCTDSAAQAVDLWPLNGPATSQAVSDNPTNDCGDHIVPLLTDETPRECGGTSRASTSRGVSSTQTRLYDLLPSRETSQSAPRQESQPTGPSRKRKRSQLQDLLTATNGLDPVVGSDSGSDAPIA